jgi:ATP-dependent RNA helicase DDX27
MAKTSTGKKAAKVAKTPKRRAVSPGSSEDGGSDDDVDFFMGTMHSDDEDTAPAAKADAKATGKATGKAKATGKGKTQGKAKGKGKTQGGGGGGGGGGDNDDDEDDDDEDDGGLTGFRIAGGNAALGAPAGTQAAWSFAGNQEATLGHGAGTSVDEKIQRRVMQRIRREGRAAAGAKDDNTDSESESGGDAPAAGSDSDGSDDEGSNSDDDDDGSNSDDDGSSGDGDSDDEEESDPIEEKYARGGKKKAAAAAAATAAAAAATSSSSSSTKKDAGKNKKDGGNNKKDAGSNKKDAGKKAAWAEAEDIVQKKKGDKRAGGGGGDNDEDNGAYFRKQAGAKQRAAFRSFQDLKLSRPINKAVESLGYVSPTPIQAQAIPVAMLGRDICGAAQTGSGKTAAFLIPVLERLMHRSRAVNATRVLVLLPTRELAVQCQSMCERLGQFTDVRSCCIVGGMSSVVQESQLRDRPDIVIATPGRILDHALNSRGFSLDEVEILIMDEADRLLEMGFAQEIEEIVRSCPSGRQTLLFSATMTEEVSRLTKLALRNPTLVRVDPNITTVDTLSEEFIRLKRGDDKEKEAHLMSLVSRSFKSRTLVFTTTKHQAHRLKIIMGLSGLRASELHGNLTQAARLAALEAFRDGTADILVATDVAARGLDIPGVATVICYDVPRDPNAYVHRVGRTARAGRKGRSVTLVSDGERANLKRAIGSRDKSSMIARTVPRETSDHWAAKIRSFEREIGGCMMVVSVRVMNRTANSHMAICI